MSDDKPGGDRNFSLSDNRIRPTIARMSLWTHDIARLEEFYTRLFGFERIFARRIKEPTIVGSWHFSPDSEMDIVLLRAPRGETELGLSSMVDEDVATRPTARDGKPFAGTPYMVFYVPDLDAVLAQVEDMGVGINRPVKEFLHPEGRRIYEVAVYDPDGTVVLVVEDIKLIPPQ